MEKTASNPVSDSRSGRSVAALSSAVRSSLSANARRPALPGRLRRPLECRWRDLDPGSGAGTVADDIAGASRAAQRLRDEPCCLDCVRGNSGWPVTALSAGAGVGVAAFGIVRTKSIIGPLLREAGPGTLLLSVAQ